MVSETVASDPALKNNGYKFRALSVVYIITSGIGIAHLGFTTFSE